MFFDSTDAGCEILRAHLDASSVRVDVLVNNAGGLGAAPGHTWDEQVEQQKFGSNLDVTALSRAFELNVVGVVRVTKSLQALMATQGGKVCIITSLMGSCGDNGSGGFLQYRVSKAAVNMAGVTMACDLKDKGSRRRADTSRDVKDAFRQLAQRAEEEAAVLQAGGRGVRRGGPGDRRAHDGNHRVVRARQLRQRTQAVPVVSTAAF